MATRVADMRREEKTLNLIEKTRLRVNDLGDPELVQVTEDVTKFLMAAPKRAAKIGRPHLLLRLFILLLAAGMAFGVYTLASSQRLSLEADSWNKVSDLVANVVHILLFLPLVGSLIFFEGRLKRRQYLSDLNKLETLNDSIYEAQFDKNPYELPNEEPRPEGWIVEYLDCCTALLFLIRQAAHCYGKDLHDQSILERISHVRRGASDNHTRLMIKLQMLDADERKS